MIEALPLMWRSVLGKPRFSRYPGKHPLPARVREFEVLL